MLFRAVFKTAPTGSTYYSDLSREVATKLQQIADETQPE
jgi:hypothetical protein